MVGQERCKRIVSWVLEMIINHFFCLESSYLWLMYFCDGIFTQSFLKNACYKPNAALYMCESVGEGIVVSNSEV